MQRLLGSFRTFSAYNPECALVTPFLRRLTWKKFPFEWGKEEEAEYLAIKEIISNIKALSAFDMRKKTYLYTDASRRGLGYILFQQDSDDKYSIICCGSTGLTVAQEKYLVVELELSDAVWSLSKCRFYLQGSNEVNIVTDHKPLIDLYAKPLTEVTNARLLRLLEKMMDFNLKWTYIKGDQNTFADLLSRTQVARSEAPDFLRNTNMMVKRVMEGVGQRNVCWELEVMALQAADDPLYLDHTGGDQGGEGGVRLSTRPWCEGPLCCLG